MDSAQIHQVLSILHFSKDLSPSTLQQLAQIANAKTFAANTFLFREGSQEPDLFLVESGKIALEINFPGRGPTRILTIGPGEFVGWSGLVGEGRMSTSAIALEDTNVIAAPAAEIKELCESDAEFGYQIMKRLAEALARRLAATRLQLLDLFADMPAGD